MPSNTCCTFNSSQPPQVAPACQPFSPSKFKAHWGKKNHAPSSLRKKYDGISPQETPEGSYSHLSKIWRKKKLPQVSTAFEIFFFHVGVLSGSEVSPLAVQQEEDKKSIKWWHVTSSKVLLGSKTSTLITSLLEFVFTAGILNCLCLQKVSGLFSSSQSLFSLGHYHFTLRHRVKHTHKMLGHFQLGKKKTFAFSHNNNVQEVLQS